MKHKKHHRRRRNVRHHYRPRRRHNPTSYLMRAPQHGYRRRHRNPARIGELLSGGMIAEAVGAGAAFIGARSIPATFFKEYNTGILGYGMNAGVGLGISWALGKFWNAQAGRGGIVGTILAILSRAFAGSTVFGAQALSGDMEYDLGYYVSDRFPYPQGNAGPYDVFPGTPYVANPPFPATSAAAVRAGAAAAQAALAPAAAPGSPLEVGAERWGSVWR